MTREPNSQGVARQLDRLKADYDQLCAPGWRTDPAVVMGFVQAAKKRRPRGVLKNPCPREALEVVRNTEREGSGLAVE